MTDTWPPYWKASPTLSHGPTPKPSSRYYSCRDRVQIDNLLKQKAALSAALAKAVQELNLTAEKDTSYYSEHHDNGRLVHVVKQEHAPKETRL